MAEEKENPFASKKKKSGGDDSAGSMAVKFGVYLVVFLLFSVAGYATNMVLFAGQTGASPTSPDQANAEMPNGQQDSVPEETLIVEEHGRSEDIKKEDLDYIEFQPIQANLNDERMSRYVQFAVVLAVHKEDKPEIAQEVESKRLILNNWLNIYVSGLELSQVRGRTNLNRLRREIQDYFNQELWPNKSPKIHDVLIKEFIVQ